MVFNGLISVANAQCSTSVPSPGGIQSWEAYGNPAATYECRLGTTTDQPLQIETNDTVRIQISKYGKVGIGYNFQYSAIPGEYSISPQALLHLHSFKYNGSSGGGHNNTNTPLSTAKGLAASTTNSSVDFLMTNDQTGNEKTDGFKIAVTGLHTYLSNQENGNIFLYTNNNPLNQLVLSKFGKVGVGTNPSAASAQLNVLSTQNSGFSVKVSANTAAYGIESKVRNANTPVFIGGLLNQNNVAIYGNGQVAINSNQLPKWGSNWGVALKTPIESVWMTDQPNFDGDYYGFGLTWNGWYFIKSKTNTQGQAEYPMQLESTDNGTILRIGGRTEVSLPNINDIVFESGTFALKTINLFANGQIDIGANINQLPKWGSNWGVALKTPIESVWMTNQPTPGGDYYGFGLTWNGWYFIKSKTNTQGQAEYPMWLTSTDNETVLRLCGTMYAKEIFIETGWCDYVFADTYQPMTILQKEAYYKQYKHLPNVPTAKEVEENGVEVGEALTGILQNVEENRLDITQLYQMIIALQQENAELKKELTQLLKK